MIIKGIRLRLRSGIGRTIRHLQNGDDNDAVTFLHGTPADIADMHRDAVAAESMYSVRHWIVAPHQVMARSQMREVLESLAKEFSFDPARSVVIEHRKQRATPDATDVHWHVMVGEVDPATGRILTTSFDRLKHELISRISEFAFGHAFVHGKHTEAVIKGLRKRKLNCIADRLEQSLGSDVAVPGEAFTHAQHQQKKREGLDLPALRHTVSLAVSAASTPADLSSRLAAAELEARAGDKPGTWIVVHATDGRLIGALHRLAGVRKSAINILMNKAAPSVQQEKEGTTAIVMPPQHLPQQTPQSATPEPNLAASAVFEHITERLAEMEQSASRELDRAIPDFKPTPEMRQAKDASRQATNDLSRAVMRRSQLQRQIANAPPIRWWSRFTGSTKRLQRELGDLETSLDEAEVEVRRKEMAMTICRRKEVREEKAAKEIHRTTVTDIAQRQKNARNVLALLGHSKIALEEKPDVATKGLDFVLSMAKARLRRSEAVADQLLDLGADRKLNRL